MGEIEEKEENIHSKGFWTIGIIIVTVVVIIILILFVLMKRKEKKKKNVPITIEVSYAPTSIQTYKMDAKKKIPNLPTLALPLAQPSERSNADYLSPIPQQWSTNPQFTNPPTTSPPTPVACSPRGGRRGCPDSRSQRRQGGHLPRLRG